MTSFGLSPHVGRGGVGGRVGAGVGAGVGARLACMGVFFVVGSAGIVIWVVVGGRVVVGSWVVGGG